MSTIQLNSSYLKHNGKNEPINTTSSGIKCSTCSKLLHPSQIQQHMQTHIDKKYSVFTPSTQQKKTKRMQVSQSVYECLQTEAEEAIPSVQTIIYGRMPAVQTQRRKSFQVQKSIEEYQSIRLSKIDNKQLKVKRDYKQQITSRLGVIGLNSQEEINMIGLEQNLAVPIQKVKVGRTCVNVYQNKRQCDEKRQVFEDKGPAKGCKKKNTISFLSSKIPDIAYQIIQEEPESKSISSKKKQIEDSRNRATVQISFKRFPNGSKIGNFNTKDISRLENIETEENENHSTNKFFGGIIDQRQVYTFYKGKANQCPSCHGFYCQTCKSTVPPQLRPVTSKDSRGNAHQETINSNYSYLKTNGFGQQLKNGKNTQGSTRQCFKCSR